MVRRKYSFKIANNDCNKIKCVSKNVYFSILTYVKRIKKSLPYAIPKTNYKLKKINELGFYFFSFKKGNNWLQVTVFHCFWARTCYGEFDSIYDHSQTDSPAQSIKSATFPILFIYWGADQSFFFSFPPLKNEQGFLNN